MSRTFARATVLPRPSPRAEAPVSPGLRSRFDTQPVQPQPQLPAPSRKRASSARKNAAPKLKLRLAPVAPGRSPDASPRLPATSTAQAHADQSGRTGSPRLAQPVEHQITNALAQARQRASALFQHCFTPERLDFFVGVAHAAARADALKHGRAPSPEWLLRRIQAGFVHDHLLAQPEFSAVGALDAATIEAGLDSLARRSASGQWLQGPDESLDEARQAAFEEMVIDALAASIRKLQTD